METTFNNVMITIEADSPEKAYTRLCEILEVGCKVGELEYTTDSFSLGDSTESHDTSELWPK